MKKLLAIVLAAVMVLSLAACGNTSGGASDTTQAASQTNAAESQAAETAAAETEGNAEVELKSYKIGVLSHTNSGGCWERILDAADHVAKNLNCEVTSAVGSSPDQILSEVENFIASGCDGVIVMNEGGVTSRLIDLCEESGVYIVFSDCGFSVNTDDADYDTYKTNEFYCGNVAHDEYADSYACAEDMIAKGAKHFVIYGLPPGISNNFDKRAIGAEDAVDKAGLDYVEVRSYSLAQVSPTVMSQNPDTDAIFSFVTTPDSFNVDEFVANYAGKVQVSAYMCGDVTEEFEKGFLTHVSCGSEARIEMAFALLYNAMTGHRIADADKVAPIIEYPHMWITDADDYKVFISNVTGGKYAYSFDEVKEWLSIYGNDVTIDELQKTALEFSDGTWIEEHK